MKGLLIKDFCLTFQRKQSLIAFLAVCLIMGYTTDGSFVIAYMTFLSAIIAISTISYDDADNGMPFIMTLPVTRKQYALSKYIGGAVCCAVGWIIAIILQAVLAGIRGASYNFAEEIVQAPIFLAMGFLILDLMIPLQIKFGAEKSRMVMLIVFGGITAMGITLKKVLTSANAIDALIANLNALSGASFVIASIAIVAVASLVSILLCFKVIENKAY